MKVYTHRSTEAFSSNPQSFCNDFSAGQSIILNNVNYDGDEYFVAAIRSLEDFAFKAGTTLVKDLTSGNVSVTTEDLIIPAGTLIFVDTYRDQEDYILHDMFNDMNRKVTFLGLKYGQEYEVGVVIDQAANIAYLIALMDIAPADEFSQFIADCERVGKEFSRHYSATAIIDVRGSFSIPNEVCVCITIYKGHKSADSDFVDVHFGNNPEFNSKGHFRDYLFNLIDSTYNELINS